MTFWHFCSHIYFPFHIYSLTPDLIRFQVFFILRIIYSHYIISSEKLAGRGVTQNLGRVSEKGSWDERTERERKPKGGKRQWERDRQ
jgi:hypothetical protein